MLASKGSVDSFFQLLYRVPAKTVDIKIDQCAEAFNITLMILKTINSTCKNLQSEMFKIFQLKIISEYLIMTST